MNNVSSSIRGQMSSSGFFSIRKVKQDQSSLFLNSVKSGTSSETEKNYSAVVNDAIGCFNGKSGYTLHDWIDQCFDNLEKIKRIPDPTSIPNSCKILQRFLALSEEERLSSSPFSSKKFLMVLAIGLIITDCKNAFDADGKFRFWILKNQLMSYQSKNKNIINEKGEVVFNCAEQIALIKQIAKKHFEWPTYRDGVVTFEQKVEISFDIESKNNLGDSPRINSLTGSSFSSNIINFKSVYGNERSDSRLDSPSASQYLYHQFEDPLNETKTLPVSLNKTDKQKTSSKKPVVPWSGVRVGAFFINMLCLPLYILSFPFLCLLSYKHRKYCDLDGNYDTDEHLKSLPVGKQFWMQLSGANCCKVISEAENEAKKVSEETKVSKMSKVIIFIKYTLLMPFKNIITLFKLMPASSRLTPL